jgi:RNA recognition motif-containing protein
MLNQKIMLKKSVLEIEEYKKDVDKEKMLLSKMKINEETNEPEKKVLEIENYFKIKVYNLSKNISEAGLYEKFSEFGRLKKLGTPKKDENSVVIEYHEMESAKNALMSLNDKLLYGSIVKIKAII